MLGAPRWQEAVSLGFETIVPSLQFSAVVVLAGRRAVKATEVEQAAQPQLHRGMSPTVVALVAH